MISRFLFAGAVIALAPLFAPSAHADYDAYVAVSAGLRDNVAVGGIAVDTDEDTARIRSVQNCQSKGGENCIFQVSAHNACAAAAVNDYGELATTTGPFRSAASDMALGGLSDQRGAYVVVVGCTPVWQAPRTIPRVLGLTPANPPYGDDGLSW